MLPTTLMLAIGGCTDTSHVDTSESALTSQQCTYAAVDGMTTVCHATSSTKYPYTILKVSQTGCVSHAMHSNDYVAINDPTCSGGGCLPVDAPCDATLPCCEGASCSAAGTCVTDVLPTPLLATFVSSMITDTGGGIYYNWIGAWAGVTAGNGGERFGYLLPWDEPNTPQVETQFYSQEYTSPMPSVLTIGPSNSGFVPEQILTVVSDSGTLNVFMSSMNPDDCVRTRFYVATNGSTYHSRADHDYSYSPAKENIFTETCFGHPVVGPDLTPEQAMVPAHLARAAQP